MKSAFALIPRLGVSDVDAALDNAGLPLASDRRKSLLALLNAALSGYVVAHVWRAHRLRDRPFEREERLKKLHAAADKFHQMLGGQEARERVARWLEHDREIREARIRYASKKHPLPKGWEMLRSTAEAPPSRPGGRPEAELLSELTERIEWLCDAARLAAAREREILEASKARKRRDEALRPLFHVLVQAWPSLFGKELKVTVRTDSHKVEGKSVAFLEQVFARYAELVPGELSAASGKVEGRLRDLKGYVLHSALRDARDHPPPKLFDHFQSGN